MIDIKSSGKFTTSIFRRLKISRSEDTPSPSILLMSVTWNTIQSGNQLEIVQSTKPSEGAYLEQIEREMGPVQVFAQCIVKKPFLLQIVPDPTINWTTLAQKRNSSPFHLQILKWPEGAQEWLMSWLHCPKKVTPQF